VPVGIGDMHVRLEVAPSTSATASIAHLNALASIKCDALQAAGLLCTFQLSDFAIV
jgi:hypothetical protein